MRKLKWKYHQVCRAEESLHTLSPEDLLTFLLIVDEHYKTDVRI